MKEAEAKSRIRCRILNLDFLSEQNAFENYLGELPVSGYWMRRREAIRRYRFPADQVRSLGAGLLLYSVLKEYEMQHTPIAVSPYGKPLLEGSDFCFNLSHSGNYAVCSYGYGSSGVDIECDQSAKPELAKQFFHQKESNLVSEFGEKMFIRLWTLKESYIKENGKGLSLGLDTFCISPGRTEHVPSSDFMMIPAISDMSSVEGDDRFHFAEFVVDGYHISVCSKNAIDRCLIRQTL